jgi:hypothetical protein
VRRNNAPLKSAKEVYAEIHPHRSGCPRCQSDNFCQEYDNMRAYHRRLCRHEGDAEMLAMYAREDKELQEERDALDAYFLSNPNTIY